MRSAAVTLLAPWALVFNAAAPAFTQETTPSATVGGAITQFYQSALGSSDARPTYGTRIDLDVDVAARAVGLWNGLAFHARVSSVFANARRETYGAILPVNAALPLNPSALSELDFALHIAQSVGPKVLVTLGKFDMLETGGRGVDRFMNLELVAPFTGIMPPSAMGATVSIKTGVDEVKLMVYDPADHTGRAGFSNVFDRGVTYAGTIRLASEYRGLAGEQLFSGAYSSEDGLEFRDLPDMRLPGNVHMRGRDHRWYLAYGFRQLVAADITWSAQLAWADGNPNPMQWSFVTAVNAGERFGVGIFYMNLSVQARNALSSWATLSHELGGEVFYTIPIGGLRFTPDVQIVNGAQSGTGFTVIGGARASYSF